MKSAGQREPDRDELELWLTQFSKACLRITSKQDLDGVLQGASDLAARGS